MGKAPAFQFYPGDWRRDTQVQMASMETRGVWFEMLCCMWDAPERGKLEGEVDLLCRLLGCDSHVLSNALTEITKLKIGNVEARNGDGSNVTFPLHVTQGNIFVTVINRRMYRDEKQRKNTRLRVRKHRETKSSNASVTPPSSSSSSSSSSSTSKNKDIYSDFSAQVLSYLNQKTGKNYRRTEEIEARLKDGGTLEECKIIIDNKLQDPHFQENPRYFSPTTLFRKSHWDKYLNDTPAKTPQLDDFIEPTGQAMCSKCGKVQAYMDGFCKACFPKMDMPKEFETAVNKAFKDMP